MKNEELRMMVEFFILNSSFLIKTAERGGFEPPVAFRATAV
jgi:hypothetical protein